MSSSPLETGTGLLERVINGRKETETDRHGGEETDREARCVCGCGWGGGHRERFAKGVFLLSLLLLLYPVHIEPARAMWKRCQ